MNKVSKTGGVLWIIVSIICLLSAAGILYFLLEERDRRIETEQRLSETEKAKRAVEIKLDQAQLQLIQLRDKARLLAIQVEEEKRSYQSALAEVEKKDAQIKEMENNLASEKKQRRGLADTLAQLRESHDSLEGRLRQARLDAEGLKSRLEEFESKAGRAGKAGVELKKIVVKPKKQLSGKVLVVNREFHFVVIDLGKKDKVSAGDEFIVYRGSAELGRVRVEKVYEAMSTAAILAGSREQEFGEDNVVKSF